MGNMENEMETTILHWVYIGDNGKYNGKYYIILMSGGDCSVL